MEPVIWTYMLILMLPVAFLVDTRVLPQIGAPLHTRRIQQLQESAAANNTSVRQPLTTNKTCTAGEAYIDCYIDPCDYFPCPVGYLGQVSGCGGTCRCKCRADVNATSVTNVSGVTGPSNATNAATNAAAANAAQQQLFSDEQGQQQGQCIELFYYCTCSTQCCGALVCGFPPRGGQGSGRPANNGTGSSATRNCSTAGRTNSSAGSNHSTASTGCSNEAAVTVAGLDSRWENASSSSLWSQGVRAAADSNAAGPSCRTLSDIDGISGIVNYGC